VLVIEGLGISATPKIDDEYDYEHERTNWQSRLSLSLGGHLGYGQRAALFFDFRGSCFPAQIPANHLRLATWV
jgi:hypothetical protein